MKAINLLLIFAVNVCAGACLGQIVTNGDFESPVAASGNALYFQTNVTSATWMWTAPVPTSLGSGGIISPPGAVPSQSSSFHAPAAPSGKQIAFVQLAFTNVSSMSQAITLPEDGVYTISYYDAGRPFLVTGVGGNTTYNLLLDTNVIASVSTTTGQPFTPEKFTFSSTAGQHTLAFKLFAEPTYDNTAFFDNVQVVYAGPLVTLDLYAGLNISGVVGSTNAIQYATNASDTNWVTLTNLVLPQSPYLFVDTSASARSGVRFYRAVLVP